MDPFEVLLKQHRSIQDKLEALQATDVIADRSRLLDQLRSEIELHFYLEEAHVYPILEEFNHLKRQVFAFWREHERILLGLDDTSYAHEDERRFQLGISSVLSMFEEHAREEERHVFLEGRKLLGSDQRDRMVKNLKATASERGIAA